MRFLLALCLASSVVLGGCCSERRYEQVGRSQVVSSVPYAPPTVADAGEIVWESEPYTLEQIQPVVVKRAPAVVVREAARPAPPTVRTVANFAPPPPPPLPADCRPAPVVRQPARPVCVPAARPAPVRMPAVVTMRACVPPPSLDDCCPGGNCGIPSLDDSCPGGNCAIPALDASPCDR